jgi:hypothetical protein
VGADDAVPWWWPLAWLALAGVATALAIERLPGAWNGGPESSWGVIQPGQDEIHPFVPEADVVATSRG